MFYFVSQEHVERLKESLFGSERDVSLYDMYDDEYDDTYDSQNVGAQDQDSADELTELTERRLVTFYNTVI